MTKHVPLTNVDYDYELQADIAMSMLSGVNAILDGRTKVDISQMTNAWEIARDAVNYPVEIVEGFYKNSDGEVVRAEGITNTGRANNFNFVVADRLRDGNQQVIFAPTGLYATLNTADQYADLEKQLMDAGHTNQPVELYVSGNGGAQSLTVAILDKVDLSGTKDKLQMRIALHTSYDGSRLHAMSMYAYSENGDISMYGGEFNLKARHTQTIGERTVDFLPAIRRIVDHWNSHIMPYMVALNDNKFDRNQAIEMLNFIAEDANVAEKHRVNIRQLYEGNKLRTNEEQDSLYTVNLALNQYIGDNDSLTEEHKERMRQGVSKAVAKQFKKLQNHG